MKNEPNFCSPGCIYFKDASMKFTRLLLLLAIPFYLFSCKPQQKLPNYLEDFSNSTEATAVKIPELKIQKGDLLSIQVYSLATDPAVDQYWNLPMQYTGVGPSLGQGTTSGGFLVDRNGDLEHFRLGTIHVEGLTKKQLVAEIKKRLTQPVELLANPTVTIRFLNYQVTVNGDVGKAGTIIVPGESITILQAIALSGDFNQYGRKDSVKVIREVDGNRVTGFIDLSKKKAFESPFYYLLQNDQVIVDPGKIKAKSLEQAVVAQKVTFALTIATVAASIANIIINSAK
jgi:polysaccharide export outer membrane protein